MEEAGRTVLALLLMVEAAAGRTTPLLLLRALVVAGKSSLLAEVTPVSLGDDMRRA